MSDNELIDNFMGFKWVEVGYFGDPETETEWQRNNKEWMDSVGMESIGDYSVNVPANLWRELEDVDYKSWEQLMPVVEKINNTIHPTLKERIDVIIYRRTCHINDMQQIIIETTGKDMLDCTYKAVVEFIKWYNSQK